MCSQKQRRLRQTRAFSAGGPSAGVAMRRRNAELGAQNCSLSAFGGTYGRLDHVGQGPTAKSLLPSGGRGGALIGGGSSDRGWVFRTPVAIASGVQ